MRYEAKGNARGACGHRHRTIRTALACALVDSRACHALGGGCYSDRVVRRVDGEPMDEHEREALDDAWYDAAPK